jgi:diguanylate cyclase (GGDEF)-like protein/PAS domain S-box-containing protein
MDVALRILHLVKNAKDTEKLRNALALENISCQIVNTSTEEELQAELDKQHYHMIFANFDLENINPYTALKFARKRQPDIPFIMIFDQFNEAQAVECLNKGITNYIAKTQMKDLGILVKRMFARHKIDNIQTSKAVLNGNSAKSDNLPDFGTGVDMILNHTSDGVILLDTQGLISYANPTALVFLEVEAEKIIGCSIEKFIFSGSSEEIYPSKPYSTITQNVRKKLGIPEFKHFLFRKKSGKSIPVEFKSSLLHDKNGYHVGVMLIFRDLSPRLKIEEQLAQQACFDSLTGLPNRFLFEETLKHITKKASSRSKKVGVIFIDLDNFKEVNDTLGHGMGDKLLKEVARKLTELVRGADFLARIGGDEFVLLVDKINESVVVTQVAERIIKALSKPLRIGDYELYMRASLGIAVFPDNANSNDDLLKNADMAMYLAKKNGGNSYRYYSDELNACNREYLEIKNQLYQAVEKKEFVLNFQPQLAVGTNQIVGFEVLLRWMSSKLGNVSPDKFIPIAEECGVIKQISEWVIDAAFAQYQDWVSEGIITPNITMSINISQIIIPDMELFEKIIEAVNIYNVKPQSIEIEITETAVMKDIKKSAKLLERFDKLNLHIAIDDFGKGFTSLSYLKQLPINSLKIDQLFIKDLVHDGDSQAIVKAIIQMAHSLGLVAIAEGVENKQQLQFLQQHQCDYMQGYYYSRPLDKVDMFRLLKDKLSRGRENGHHSNN